MEQIVLSLGVDLSGRQKLKFYEVLKTQPGVARQSKKNFEPPT